MEMVPERDATKLDWSNIQHFKQAEFPAGELEFASAQLIVNLDRLRTTLGVPIYPTPVKGGLSRRYGPEASRHYASADKRILSTAVDIFVDASPVDIWFALLEQRTFNGIGIYPYTHYDGKHWPMFHIDMRPVKGISQKTLWMRVADETYIYPLDSHEWQTEFFSEMTVLLHREEMKK